MTEQDRTELRRRIDAARREQIREEDRRRHIAEVGLDRMDIRRCPHCTLAFEPRVHNQSYCSYEHRRAAARLREAQNEWRRRKRPSGPARARARLKKIA